MNEDAEVIIKISGDTKNFDSKYAQLVKEYKNKEIDIGITANDLEVANSELNEMNRTNDRIENNLKEIKNQIKDYENAIASLNEKNATLNKTIWEERHLYHANLNKISSLNSKIDAQRRLSYDVSREHSKQLDAILKQYNVIDKIEAKYEKQKNDLTVIGQKIQEAGNVDLGSRFEGANKSISKTIKNVGKWGLAIFGVRSAYLGIRRLMTGTLSQNEKLAGQMDGIRNSLYAAFVPVVQKIINLIKTLMGYANAIWQKLFGKDLFKATSKSAQKTASAAKEINKQLAGFDEANVLSDNKSSGGGGGSTDGGIDIPIKKLPDWLDKFIDWCKDNPTLAKILFGIAAFTLFGGWKIAAGLGSAVATLLGISGTGALATGASGLLGVLHVLSLLTLAAFVIKLDYDKLKELNKELDLLAKSRANNKKWLEMTDNAQGELNDRLEEATELTDDATNAIQGHIKNLIDEVAVNKVSADTRKLSKKQLDETIKGYSDAYKQGKLTEDQEKDYAKFIRENLVGAFAAGSSGANQMEEDLKALDKKYGTSYYLDIQEHGLDEFGDKLKKTGSKIDTFLKKWQQVGDKILASFNITSASQYKAMFHADGGIVNMPGRGVPVHYAGEAGREGIVPIDNESQMALLGSEIAKRVTINLTTINQMNGRTISRELNKINGESSFLTNS